MNKKSPPSTDSSTSTSLKWLCENGHAMLARGAGQPTGLSTWQKALMTQQAAYRGRLRRRFPDDANWLWTDMSLSQASDWWSAQFKASLFPQDAKVVDACCGAGIDAIALAARGPIHAVDIANDLVAIAEANLRYARKTGHFDHNSFEVTQGELPEGFPQSAQWMHADPDRRPQGQKCLDANDFLPSLNSLLEIAQRLKGSVVKVAPSTQFDEHLDEQLDDYQRIWTGSFDQCRQQLLVSGGCRRDDVHPDHCGAILCYPQQAEFWGSPTHYCEIEATPEKFVCELHPALHAAALNECFAGENDLTALSDPRGYYTTDEFIASPLVSSFEVVDVLPWDDRKVRKWLRSEKIGQVEVKCRSAKVDANHFQRRYSSGKGDRSITLLVTTLAERVRAIACNRVI